MQIQTTIRYYCTSIRIGKIKTNILLSAGGDVEQLGLAYIGGSKMKAILDLYLTASYKVKHIVTV